MIMKKSFFLILSLIIFLFTVQAQNTVTVEEARTVAQQILKNTQISCSETLYDENSNPAVYIFNGKTSYAVIAADKRVQPLLAYSYESTIPTENKVPALEMWLDSYSRQIAEVRKVSDLPQNEGWSQFFGKETQDLTETEVKPFLTSKWGQGRSYNYYCPMDNGGDNGRCVTGCVATALAQIIYYYRFPESGVGSYSYEDENYGTQSANFAESVYDFSHMPDVPFGVSTAISHLMRDCGVACDLVYGPDGTGMYNHKAAYALRTHFKYAPETEYIFRDSVSLNWDSLMVSKLTQRIPLYYAGWSVPNIVGHAFVCDGYQQMADSSYYFHFNFGWNGNSDGYFYTTHLRPGGGNYDLSQEIIVAYPDTAQYDYAPTVLTTGSVTLVEESGSFDDGSGNIFECAQNMDYQWIIRPQIEDLTQINLNIHFEFAAGDTLFVTAATLGERFFTDSCGFANFEILDDEVTLRLVTDNIAPRSQGFSASYASVFPEYCVEPMVLGSSSGTISDRSGDDDYQNLTYCQTYVMIGGCSAIHVDFTEFDLEDGKDFLYIYNNKAIHDTLILALTGQLDITSYTFNTNRLRFVFVTDEENRAPGWSLNYYGGTAEIGENTLLEGAVTPNPANDKLNITLAEEPTSATYYHIYDLYGKMLTSGAIRAMQTTVQVSDLPAGAYFVKVLNGKQSMVRKVIIAR